MLGSKSEWTMLHLLDHLSSPSVLPLDHSSKTELGGHSLVGPMVLLRQSRGAGDRAQASHVQGLHSAC